MADFDIRWKVACESRSRDRALLPIVRSCGCSRHRSPLLRTTRPRQVGPACSLHAPAVRLPEPETSQLVSAPRGRRVGPTCVWYG